MQKQTEGKRPTNPDPSPQSKSENQHSRIQHTILKTPVLLNTLTEALAKNTDCNGRRNGKNKNITGSISRINNYKCAFLIIGQPAELHVGLGPHKERGATQQGP